MTILPLFLGTLLLGTYANGLPLSQATPCEENSILDIQSQVYKTSSYNLNLSCRSFMKCINGTYVTKHCPSGEVFDPATKGCVQGTSCRNCKKGETKPSSTCVTYKACQNGEWVEEYCPAYKKYDIVRKTCVWYDQYNCTVSQKESCLEGETLKISCRRYQTCLNGELVNAGCPVGEVFDEISRGCVAGDCERRNYRDCYEGEKKRIGDDDRRYTECVDGRKVLRMCPDWSYFDDRSETCVYEKHCPEEPTDEPATETPEPPTDQPTTPERPTEQPTTPEPPTDVPTTSVSPTTQTEPPTTPPTTTTPTTPAPTTTEPPKCTDGEKQPDKENCKKYKECKNGAFEEETCTWFRHFDSKSLKCEFFGYTCAS